ncbi:18153_t:CDS:2 [Rhizophagus irregularis]|nr:18153_t:CDS:2 [Rhizophagus irregularis]
MAFLQQYNLILENILPEHKSKICCSNKDKEIYVLQCCCGKDCQRNLPVQPPPLRINETVKLMAQNLLHINVHPSHNLDDNIDYISNHLEGKVLIDDERYLLSNQDIINIRNSMTKDLWGIDKRKAEEININQIFGPKKQRELAWEFGHNKILHLDGTFAAGGVQKASNSYNHTIVKELLLHYKHKLEQKKGHVFTSKVAMTDCDHKERKALIEIWPNIHLILCLFHVSQSWENKFKIVLGHHGESSYINQITQVITNTEILLKNQIKNNLPKSKVDIIRDAVLYSRLLGRESIYWMVRTLKRRLENQLMERHQNYTFSPTDQQFESHYQLLI